MRAEGSPNRVVPAGAPPGDVEDGLEELDPKHGASLEQKKGVLPSPQFDGEEESQSSSLNEELDLVDSPSLEQQQQQPEREASPLSQCSSDGSGDSTVKPITKIRKTDKSIGEFCNSLMAESNRFLSPAPHSQNSK